jgi:hypothetical protein
MELCCGFCVCRFAVSWGSNLQVEPGMLHDDSGRGADTELHAVFPSWVFPRIFHGLEITTVTSQ